LERNDELTQSMEGLHQRRAVEAGAGVFIKTAKLWVSLPLVVDTALIIEKLRVASQIRQSHVAHHDEYDIETSELHRRLLDLETYVDDRIAILLEAHPAYPWVSKVKGVGREDISKVIRLIDINKANTISSLWKFAGYAPVDGHAEKRQKGAKLPYSFRLRTMS
jgi:hypothetical protein